MPAQEYLSGDVRAKLRQAAAAAADDPAYQGNVEALTEVIPPDLGPAEIEARLGAVFITPAEVQQFLRETLADAAVTVDARRGRHMVGDRRRPAQRSGHHHLGHQGPGRARPRRAPPQPQRASRGHPHRRRRERSGRTRRPPRQPGRSRPSCRTGSPAGCGRTWTGPSEICRRYNDAFNAIVLRSYDDVQLSLPGVNRDITLFWWQKAAIARMIYEPTAGLFHDMGAGKTLEQIIGVMEQKRLGLIRKPVICVKNHLLDQFRGRVPVGLPAGADHVRRQRRPDRGRAAAVHRPLRGGEPGRDHHDPRGVRVDPADPRGPRSLPGLHEGDVPGPRRGRHRHGQGRGDAAGRVRAAAARLLRPRLPAGRRARRASRTSKQGKRKVEQDPAMCWEQMGADYICVDESQDFNNLWVPSDEPGMAIGFVHRAIDLEMKLHAIRRQVRQPGLHPRHRNPRHQQDPPVLRPAAVPAARSGSRRPGSPGTRRGPRPTPNPSSGWR